MTEECLIKKCKDGVWRTSLNPTVCCYERKAHPPNTIVSTAMSEDLCVKASLECKENGGEARLELSMKNFCAQYVTQHEVEEIKNLVEKTFLKDCKTDSSEQTSNQLLRGIARLEYPGK